MLKKYILKHKILENDKNECYAKTNLVIDPHYLNNR